LASIISLGSGASLGGRAQGEQIPGRKPMVDQSVLVTLVVGGVAGWLAGLVMRGAGYGIIGDVIVGLIGAFLGSYLVRAMHVRVDLGNPWFNLGAIAFVGAVVLMLIVGLLRPRTFGDHVRGWWRR
jgi:uncharacterized membrane protein YeaQ/YmgE (transglycosylase-associated protein family)